MGLEDGFKRLLRNNAYHLRDKQLGRVADLVEPLKTHCVAIATDRSHSELFMTSCWLKSVSHEVHEADLGSAVVGLLPQSVQTSKKQLEGCSSIAPRSSAMPDCEATPLFGD